ncbi:MAG: energy transducer TonB [Proteobacteria bacterium]|nr:energy transducer TonB [Pseudomonadota bacterium]
MILPLLSLIDQGIPPPWALVAQWNLAEPIHSSARAVETNDGSEPPRSAVPATNPANWITPLDYPLQLVGEGKEGQVAFKLAVDITGRPSSCAVTASSGNAILDSQTCALLIRRAHFKPALDTSGKPVAGQYSNRVTWKIPSPPPLKLGTSTVTVQFTVGADGVVRDCSQQRDLSGSLVLPVLSQSYCDLIVRFEPFQDDAGVAVERRVQMQIGGSVRLVENEPIGDKK